MVNEKNSGDRHSRATPRMAGGSTSASFNIASYSEGHTIAEKDDTPESPLFAVQSKDYFCASTTKPYETESKELVGTIVGQPRWSDERLHKTARTTGNSSALLKAFRSYGSDLTSVVSGSFAFVIIDQASRVLLFGNDRMGRIPIYYCLTEGGFHFATSLEDLTGISSVPKQVSEQGLFNYVYFHMVPSPDSIFESVSKLPMGRIAEFQDGSISIKKSWSPAFAQQGSKKSNESGGTLRILLKQAVANCLPSESSSMKVGAFLSGGLDSSTVSGMLSELYGGSCDAYSIGFQEPGYDELEFARLTSRHFGIRLHEYYVTPDDVVEALPMIAENYEEPFGNSSALPTYFCAKMASEANVSLLLAGDGGDEIFAGNERYAKQKAFSLFESGFFKRLNQLGDFLVKRAPSQIPIVPKARSYLAQAKMSVPERLQFYNFLHRFELNQIFEQSFLSQVDAAYPLNLLQEAYDMNQEADELNRILYMDWQFTLADNDLRKVSRACTLAGVEVDYPMLDDDLVAFSCGIPSKQKLPGRKLRDFYKRSLKGWLPDATLAKDKHGFGLPFGIWMRSHRPLQELAYESVISLKKRDIFRPEFLDRAISMHRDGHAMYFGELIWILCVLELWMASQDT